MQQERIRHLAKLLAAGGRARDAQAEAMMDGGVAAAAAPARQTLDVVEQALSAPPDGVDAAKWRAAREQLLTHARNGLVKLQRGDLQLAADEGCAMEAVIISDGTRPSFLLCDGEIDPKDPFIGPWDGNIATAQALGIARLAAAVGRIQPQHGHASRYVGTGTLIDRDAGLILTNYHVIEQAQHNYGVAMTRDGDRLRVDGWLEIDFVGEACSLRSQRFRIVEVALPQGYGSTFAGIDAAVARIEPLPDSPALPDPAPLLSAEPAYATGAISSLALIGFPAQPALQDGKDVDWNFVLRVLFGNRFGVKRLAPGHFTLPLGSHALDQGRRAIGHDATTFGGASGALVMSWLDDRTPSFALHFGGTTGASNYALSFAASHQALRAIGARF
ncbi:Trypsin-like peptidase domain-containing protein [Lysobacter sp. yr284]|nr:Trypsin-like peptidase domain-containing protein [Lysobacter sp. yr284]